MQQHHIFVADIFLNVPIQLAHRRAPALDGLKKNTAPVAENARDAGGRVVLARLGEDGINGFLTAVNGTAGIKKSNKHGGPSWSVNEENEL